MPHFKGFLPLFEGKEVVLDDDTAIRFPMTLLP
jgi:hypothetical protein